MNLNASFSSSVGVRRNAIESIRTRSGRLERFALPRLVIVRQGLAKLLQSRCMVCVLLQAWFRVRVGVVTCVQCMVMYVCCWCGYSRVGRTTMINYQLSKMINLIMFFQLRKVN